MRALWLYPRCVLCNFVTCSNGLPPAKFYLSTTSPPLPAIFRAHAGAASDPFRLVAGEMATLDAGMARAMGSDHPMLARLAGVLFGAAGKRVRPAVVYLISQAMVGGARDMPSSALTDSKRPDSRTAAQPQEVHLDELATFSGSTATASSVSDAVFSATPAAPTVTSAAAAEAAIAAAEAHADAAAASAEAAFAMSNTYPPHCAHQLAESRDGITEGQRRLAEISEMIHTASLLHDDVIDEAATRRGAPSANSVFGNKVAVLGGDYLLARASVALARLRHPLVVELISTVIEHLVKGEIMQLKPSLQCGQCEPDQSHYSARQQQSQGQGQMTAEAEAEASQRRRVDVSDSAAFFRSACPHSSGHASSAASLAFQADLSHYLTKSYYKTASLLANSCLSAALLGGHPLRVQTLAYEFGKHLGLAFQVVDDMLDARQSAEALGKPAMNDLASGAATAPLLFALRAFPREALPILQRRGSEPGDVERMRALMADSRALEQTQRLAEECAEAALAALLQLQPSAAQSALVQLVSKVLTREK